MSAYLCGCDPEANHPCQQHHGAYNVAAERKQPQFEWLPVKETIERVPQYNIISTMHVKEEEFPDAPPEVNAEHLRMMEDRLVNERDERINRLLMRPPNFASKAKTIVARHGGMIGLGGAPTRATTLPEDGAERKKYPVASGVLDYFPDALVAISRVSWQGNEQHNPGQPLHWARGKSMDESDTMIRHFLQRGTIDTDGTRHSAKMCWRALAILQKELELAQEEEEAA